MLFKSKNPSYEHLRKKWIAKGKHASQNLIDKHLKGLAIGSLGGLMLLTAPGGPLGAKHLAQDVHESTGITDMNTPLISKLVDIVPKEVRPLDRQEEEIIAKVVSEVLDIKVTAEIDGKRLNRSYGLIGGEQHLYRYPGDTLQAHAKTAQDWAMFGGAGIAPGLGAWGYFANSKVEFAPRDEARERYYIAVQTFLTPGFAENFALYRDFFKYRKMLVVNPKTGQSVVTVIGDAGPSDWTGKHLGGSPEVMHYLGLATGSRKGAVLFFFIDDPEDKIPLGPVLGNGINSLAQAQL